MSCQYRQNPDEYDKAWGRPHDEYDKAWGRGRPHAFFIL
ncbi:hypothetical protein LTSESEN_3237 [Salmonella enterica subsp. enterica serovar Senftenberg str. A4-543]|uniref:Uncharacterized protein n=1 Tax=Salmonella enterica subsp. enterica serovar Senftenberg str. A4-543 TaxID=913082 RepID=G5R1N2_SALSE|nr:hypothetical protein LTSESEN_3237 [Salmonella enterica subsp. enterica serovar Senftenberg str. A4-543]